jgi:propanediol dehydratase small subunit
MVKSSSGRDLDDLNLEGVLSGELTADDFRISRETLLHQANAAQANSCHQLATNLRRAAELTAFSNQELLEIYSYLRPGRSTYEQLIALSDKLENEQHAHLTAEFIREAAEIYKHRGICKGNDHEQNSDRHRSWH